MKLHTAAIGLGLATAVMTLVGCATERTFDRPYERVAGATTITLAAFKPDGQQARHRLVSRSDSARRDTLTWGEGGENQAEVSVERRGADRTAVSVKADSDRVERELIEQIDYHSEY